MTALSQFQRLESEGVWRESAASQRRNVVVSFGDASLIISDQREQALTHWSLAAIQRVNPGEAPAVFSPGTDSDEQIEIADETMTEAIQKVTTAIERSRPRKGRLRLVFIAVVLAAFASASVFWLPGALREHSLRVVPASARSELGSQMLAQLRLMAGTACSATPGRAALARLARGILGPGAGQVVVVPAGVALATHFPGQVIILNRAIVEDFEDTEVVAGFILAEAQRRAETDPLDRVLRLAGPLANIRLLTTGKMTDRQVRDVTQAIVTAPAPALASETLLARFKAAGVASGPYAYALDPSGEDVLALIEGDPMRGQARRAVLNDADWIRLQAICEG